MNIKDWVEDNISIITTTKTVYSATICLDSMKDGKAVYGILPDEEQQKSAEYFLSCKLCGNVLPVGENEKAYDVASKHHTHHAMCECGDD